MLRYLTVDEFKKQGVEPGAFENNAEMPSEPKAVPQKSRKSARKQETIKKRKKVKTIEAVTQSDRILSVDEFMKQGFDSDSNEGSAEIQSEPNVASRIGMKREKKPEIKKKKKEVEVTRPVETEKDYNSDSASDSETGYDDHLTTLETLKDKDPEFFQFLSENDRNLLNFNLSGSESGESDDEAEVSVINEKFHKPPDHLQVASDESDFSADEAHEDKEQELKSGKTVVTAALISEWKDQLENKPKMSTLKTVMLAFRAAVHQVSVDTTTSTSPFVVKGPTMFNSVVRLCLTNLLPAIHRVLGLPPPTQKNVNSHEGSDLNPSKSEKWVKVKTSVRSYLSDLVKMLTSVVEADIIMVLLRHVLYWVPFYLQFPKHSRLLLKKLITFWSTSEESVRVLAFLCAIRMLRVLPTNYLDYVLKQMYLSYVNNCKFTSPNTWPLINFMKRSLVEMYSLDPNLAYQHAFVYIRQLAIHLRTALTSRKKEAYQVVYNWQYVHCLLLWSHLLSTVHPSPVLSPLVYPLVQVTLGVFNLIQTTRYLPLKFHLISSLTKLSAETNTYIPVLPLIMKIIDIIDFNKGHSSLSLKPMDFSCVLKLSKSQLQENAFRDGCLKQIYEVLLDYMNTVSHTIGFPELVFPATVQIRAFLKSLTVGNYCRQMKQILDKINENSKFISEKRSKVNFGIADFKAVEEWEQQTLKDGTPITTFYVSWRKLRDREILHSIAKKDQVKEPNLPTIDRKKWLQNKKEDQAEFSELFASDGEDEDPENDFSSAIARTEKANERKRTMSKNSKEKKLKK